MKINARFNFKFFWLITALIWVGGCQFDPFADDYTRTKPSQADVVGTYILKEQTLNDTPIDKLKAVNGSKSSIHKMVLRADGTYSLTNLPIWLGNWSSGSSDEWSVKEFKSDSGQWKMCVVGSIGEGSGKDVDIWGLDIASTLPFETVTLAGEQAPYRIIFGFGDPDGGDAMIYERENSNARNGTSYLICAFLIFFLSAFAAFYYYQKIK